MASSPDFDVVVIGGGPAGSAVSRLLASWGHQVLVLTRPVDRARGLAESIPPSARKLLGSIGVLEQVERAGTPPNRGNAVWWGSTQGRLEDFDEEATGAGFQIFRPDFDALLLAHAEAAGAAVKVGALVRSVDLHGHDVATVEYEYAGRRQASTARFAVDCSGRAGVIARRGFRVYELNHRMQAYLGIWRRRAAWSGGDDRTMVETYEDGWAWSLAISATVRQVAVMVDGATTRTTRGPTIADAYLAELAKTTHLQALIDGATLEHVWACDASLYSSSECAGPSFLLAGDAASCIDPLSSFGVKKALASAWLAAVALHTSLIDPNRRATAFDFFSIREAEVYAADLARTRDYARRAFEHHGHDFWASRASGGTPAAVAPDELLLRSPAVRAAHARLRDSPSILLRWSGDITLVQRALVRGNEIVLDDAIPIGTVALRFAHGVDLIALGDAASRHRQVPEAYDDYCRTHGETPLPQFLAALSLLLAEDVLVGGDTSVRTS